MEENEKKKGSSVAVSLKVSRIFFFSAISLQTKGSDEKTSFLVLDRGLLFLM